MAYVMVVDDDRDFANAVSKALRDAGHEVETRPDTRSAVASMEQRRPDLVVLDVMFPEDSSGGFEMARAIQHQLNKLKGTPILMLTAINSKFPLGFSSKDIDDHWLPVADFLEKPVDLDVLTEKVADLLQRASSAASDSGP